MNKLPSCSDYLSAIDTPQLLKAPILQRGTVVKRNDTIIRYVGGFCVVFPFQTPSGKYAVRCWYASVAEIQERTRKIAEKLQKVNLPYFVGFNYIAEGIVTNEGIQPIVLMDWVEAKPLKEYIKENLNNCMALKQLADNFLKMVKDLHTHQLAHGDLQHGNMLIQNDGKIILVDYDSMYVPALEGYSDDIKGLEGYQHEARWKNKKLTPKADYFSELVIYTSLLALAKYPQLWEELNIEDTETLLFSAEDVKKKGCSAIFDFLDADTEFCQLSYALKNALQCDDIDELIPLEEALKSPIDTISNKWENNGYKPVIVDNSATIQEICNSWNTVPIKQEEEMDTSSIVKKW